MTASKSDHGFKFTHALTESKVKANPLSVEWWTIGNCRPKIDTLEMLAHCQQLKLFRWIVSKDKADTWDFFFLWYILRSNSECLCEDIWISSTGRESCPQNFKHGIAKVYYQAL